MRTLLAVTAAAALLGCGMITQSNKASATLSSASIGGGSDGKSLACSNGLQLSVEWQGSQGTLDLTLYESGTAVYGSPFTPTGATQTFSKGFAGGDYTVTATRSTDWKGNFTVTLDCQ